MEGFWDLASQLSSHSDRGPQCRRKNAIPDASNTSSVPHHKQCMQSPEIPSEEEQRKHIRSPSELGR